MLSENIMDYMVIAQGKTSIPGVDDGEELTLADVRHLNWYLSKLVRRLFPCFTDVQNDRKLQPSLHHFTVDNISPY